MRELSTTRRELSGVAVALAGLLLSFVLQLGLWVYSYGRLSARVDVIEHNTQKLLELHLSNQVAKGRE